MKLVDWRDLLALGSVSALGYGLFIIHPAACWVFCGACGLFIWRRSVAHGKR